ncbi:DUF362 domain-containing protein [Desulfopila sp. IMCC35006]|uniref:DUF362 domain-containing protein n=1 Tax=Desulfopila sp. IMCC35006 TaxID=2569542 RepID=UPI0010AC7ACF|nr:DUF362 domain-containing protein [Desulfopila sp. IMCC35006]TKB25245.1 DUF362 domain-containing protein [Desulfopila sp. IMCC35006]
MDLITVDFTSYENAVTKALDAIRAHERFAAQKAILIKPNLINTSPHPITTPPACCEAIIRYIRKYSQAEIVIAEGCGDKDMETAEVFQALGYTAMADKFDIPLVDLNHAPLKSVKNPACSVFPEMHLPEIGFSHYIISVPVLKVHSLAAMTGTLKNMMGFAPPRFYSGRHGTWKKAVFHHRMQQSIADLNKYLIPNLSVVDGSIGMAEFHLGGAHCDPPVRKVIAGYDPWQVDRRAAELLGLDWRTIGHVAAGL